MRWLLLLVLLLTVLAASPALEESLARTIEVITVEDPSCASGYYSWLFVWDEGFIVHMEHGCAIFA